jgi:lipopolysaccharide assembly outer membrane protein LptD (OstA)
MGAGMALSITAWTSALPVQVIAQTTQRVPIELIHADQVTVERADTGNAYVARGSVHFRQAKSELWSDRAVWYEASEQVHLFGNVRMVDTAETFHADTVYYTAKTNLAHARGHVLYKQTRGDISASSDFGDYNRQERWAKLYDRAQLITNGDRPNARVETQADTLLFYPDADSGIAWGHVHIVRHDGDATSEKAAFISRDELERVVLTGAPAGHFRNNDVAGDTLHLFAERNELRELVSEGSARAVYREGSDSIGRMTESTIESRRMRLLFGDGALRELIAIGQAKSHYIPSRGRPGESNIASGDTVKIAITDSIVSRVQVIAGARGTYFSPKLSGGDVIIDTVDYEASYIDYHVDENWIRLWDRSEIQYGQINLASGQVLYLTDQEVLRAYAIADTVMPPPADYSGPAHAPSVQVVDTATNRIGPDSVVAPRTAADTLQRPVLRDGVQEVRGERLAYDLSTQRGRIIQSATHTEEGYYRGGNFRKESDEVFFVRDGHYTTCDLNDPHFEFVGNRMMIRKDDRVVARPVVLKIEKFPVLWVPYYVFSIRKDRHSGLLPIRFGNLQRGSRFVRNLGYYFAVSDYWDITPSADVIDQEGMLWHLASSYTLRYKLNGSISGSYGKHTRVTSTGEQRSERWNLQLYHNQTLSPTATLSGSGNFVSDNSFYQDFTSDPSDRLNRSLRSQANLSKRWGGAALVVAAEDTRNLDNDARTTTLPRMSLTLPTWQPLSPRKLRGGRVEDTRWYHQFRVSYGQNAQNFISEQRGFVAVDSVTTDTVTLEKRFATMDQRVGLTFSQRAAAFTITPGISAQETWYYIPEQDSLPAGVTSGSVYRRASGSASIGTQTTLYGLFPFERASIVAFRHVFTPSLGFSYSPAIVKNNAVRSFTGAGAGGARSATVSFGVSNLFQMKTKSGEKERNWDLLNVSSGTSYNFEALTHKLGNIGTSLRTGLTRNPDISVSLTHDPYDPVTREIDYTPRLTNISASASFSLRSGAAAPMAGADLQDSLQGRTTVKSEIGPTGWNLRASYQFSESRVTRVSGDTVTTVKSITHWLKPSLQIIPSPNWRVQTDFYYDIRQREMANWAIRVHRDLHCWEADFSWVPAGPSAGYYFRINVKSLPDVKFEKSESGLKDAIL